MKTNISFDELYREKARPLVLDGAVGSLLQQRDYEVDPELWVSELNISRPEVIEGIHKSYIDAGADIITTNTFRTNPAALKKAGLKVSEKEFVRAAVDIALEAEAITDNNILIAGSNAPAEDCYQKERILSYRELEENHKTHIDLLYETGCDFILNETLSHIDEIKIILEHCSKNSIPFILSLFFDAELKLLSGEDINYATDMILDYNPLAVGYNCISIPNFKKVVVKDKLYEKWGFYLNCGSGEYTDDKIKCSVQPDKYTEEVRNWIKYKPKFIGSCCGSSPHHTKAIKDLLDEIY